MKTVRIKTGSLRTGSLRTGSLRTGSLRTGSFRNGLLAAILLPLIVAGCGSTSGSAPVDDRTPAPTVGSTKESRNETARRQPDKSKPPTSSTSASTSSASSSTAPESSARKRATAAGTGDWRPDYYTVRKGDTLYSIALDFGHDYRDLAAWNYLANASYIQVGQRLRLFPPAGQSPTATVATPAATLPGEGNKRSTSVSAPTFADPKAYRSAYSEQAMGDMRRILAGEVETAVIAAAPVNPKPATPPATSAAPATSTAPKPAPSPAKPAAMATPSAADEKLKWEWPAPGGLLYGFAKGPIKKGVGIKGTPGQSVVSSAPGKVVYSGSGLRGYGNLLIVKHNATYLSVYAHNSQLLVSEGQMVAQGQKIAVMGEMSSGRTGLHFEIRRLGKPMDPLKYLPNRS